MASRIQQLRFHSPNERPATNAHDEGTLYINTADRQIGMYDDARVPRDLVAVRRFSTTTIYFTDDWVVTSGRIYRAIRQTGPGAFVEADWATEETAVALPVEYRDLNYDSWGLLGSGTYTISGADFEWANAPWDLIAGSSYTLIAEVVNGVFHSIEILVGADSEVDHDSTTWTRTGPTWTQAKGKNWRRGGGGPFPLVTAIPPSAFNYKIGQEWFNPSNGKCAIKIVDDGGKHLWVEAGAASLVNTNTIVPLQPPIYDDGPLDPAAYAIGQWWIDTDLSKTYNRYVNGVGDPVWVEMFSFTAP